MWGMPPGVVATPSRPAPAVAAETHPQAAVTVRAYPSNGYFVERTRTLQTLERAVADSTFAARQQGAVHMEVLTLPAPTPASRRIRRGDFLFVDDVLTGTRAGAPIGVTGADAAQVFSDFAGHAARLPPGFAIEWSPPHPGGGALGGVPARTRRLVRIRSGRPSDPQDEDTTRAVTHAALTRRNRHVRFFGVALTDYVVGAPGQDAAGVAALVSGRVTLPNTSGQVLTYGTLVSLKLPTFEAPLNVDAFGGPWQSRAVLKPYDSQTSLHDSLRESVRTLLFSEMGFGDPSSLLVTGGGSADGQEMAPDRFAPPHALPPASAADAIEELHPRETEAVPSEEAAALAIIHFAEAVAVWAAARALRAEDILTEDAGSALGKGRKAYSLRLAVARALGVVPAGLPAPAPPSREDSLLQRATGGLLLAVSRAPEALRAEAGPFARVVVPGSEGEDVDVKIL